jgi:hypothetical protein
MSLNKTHEPDCVFWCITNLILGIYLICWTEIGRPFALATSAGDIASLRTYHLSDKLFSKVITAPATQSAAFTIFVIRDKDRTYYLTDKQMRDCVVLFALARTRWFLDIDFTIWSRKKTFKYFSVPCFAVIRENIALCEGPYTSPLVLLIGVLLEYCRQVKTKQSENILSQCHIFPAQRSHGLALYWNRVCENH